MTAEVPQAVSIKKIVQENEMVKSFILDHSVGGRPGQFVNVWLPYLDEKPISIAEDDGKQMMLTICDVGAFSHAISLLKVGDRMGVRGPYGKPFSWKPHQHLVMVAGGYGAAPLYFVSKMAIQDGCTIDFILGARTKGQLLYISRLEQLNKTVLKSRESLESDFQESQKSNSRKALRLHITTDDGSMGHHGYNVDILEKILEDARSEQSTQKKPDFVFTCGPERMMKRVSDICFEKNIPAQISVERFMKCGFGVCGQCCVDDSGIPVCTNGPVMENTEVRKIKEFGVYYRDGEGRKVYF